MINKNDMYLFNSVLSKWNEINFENSEHRNIVTHAQWAAWENFRDSLDSVIQRILEEELYSEYLKPSSRDELNRIWRNLQSSSRINYMGEYIDNGIPKNPFYSGHSIPELDQDSVDRNNARAAAERRESIKNDARKNKIIQEEDEKARLELAKSEEAIREEIQAERRKYQEEEAKLREEENRKEKESIKQQMKFSSKINNILQKFK